MGKEPVDDPTVKGHSASDDGIPAPSGAANLIDTDYVIGQDNIKGEFSYTARYSSFPPPQYCSSSS